MASQILFIWIVINPFVAMKSERVVIRPYPSS